MVKCGGGDDAVGAGSDHDVAVNDTPLVKERTAILDLEEDLSLCLRVAVAASRR